VFGRFTRLDDDRGRNHGGAGLGLAIVAGIAAQHGGQVYVADSERGARVVVRLPLAPARSADRPAAGGRPRAAPERGSDAGERGTPLVRGL
jgi:K+-sensing histidine kinase KdpD